ncbi:MucR family transcriptional regulator [Embleya sp. NPDC008237]|uniref:MucR family transcriptional regulator n=1 Tax=Embleya sp. NPDC008237 TaxID=3363978 RepID=UPI0036E53F22
MPDGYGVYGVLDDDGETLLCHECGVRAAALHRHASFVHAMTAEQYRTAHGLRRTQPLVSTAVRNKQRAAALRRMERNPAGWARLEAARDPWAAVDARTPEELRGNAASHAGRLAHPGPAAKPLKARVCVRCGTTWTPPTPAQRRRRTCDGEECARMQGPYRRPLAADEIAALRDASADPDERMRLAVALTESGASQRAIAAAAGMDRVRLRKAVWQARNPVPGVSGSGHVAAGDRAAARRGPAAEDDPAGRSHG